MVGQCLPYGTWYEHGKLYIPGKGWYRRSYNGHGMSQKKIKEIEKESNRKASIGSTKDIIERESASIYQTIANECIPGSVRMVVDIPGNHATGKLPILDTQMWVHDGRIRHSHYSKPMAMLEVILARS